MYEVCSLVVIAGVCGCGDESTLWCRRCCIEVSTVVGGMVYINPGSSRKGGGIFVQAKGGVVWSGGVPLVVVAALSFRCFRLYAACCLWSSSSAPGLVASDALPEGLCCGFVSIWCFLFRLRCAASVRLVLDPLIQALPLFQKMTRASLDSIPENVVFSRIPMQINDSGSQWNSEKREHVPSWMVTREPLLVSQSPLNAVGVKGKGGRGKNVLMLSAVVGLCGAASCCISKVGGMHAPALRVNLTLVAGADVVGGGGLLMV